MTSQSLLRQTADAKSDRVGFIELFFDLVFVFAVTQLAHRIITHASAAGNAESLVMFLAVWSVWTQTTWVTNRLDVERSFVRLMLLAMMIGGILQSLAIPDAFDLNSDATAFAVVHVAMQLGRTLFVALATRPHHAGYHSHFRRVLAWTFAAAPFWIIGGFGPDEQRLGWWAAGLVVEYGATAARYRVPGLGRSERGDWAVEANHFAERCGLFVIIALGEIILITGNTIGDFTLNLVTVASLMAALISTMAMWWIYFSFSAKKGNEALDRSRDPGHMARLVYVYLHIPLLCGLLVTAAGNEGLVLHPGDPAKPGDVARLIGGPFLFLAGALAIKRVICGGYMTSHATGMAVLAFGAVLATGRPTVVVGVAAVVVLLGVAIWEEVAIRTKRQDSSATGSAGAEASVALDL